MEFHHTYEQDIYNVWSKRKKKDSLKDENNVKEKAKSN